MDNHAWSTVAAMGVKHFGCVRLSPDSSSVIFSVRQVENARDGMLYSTRYQIAPVSDLGATEPLAADGGIRDPSWSPSGDSISFVGSHAGKDRIWIADRNGRNPTIAVTADSPISSHKWSPDGSMIAYTVLEMPGDQVRAGTVGRVVRPKRTGMNRLFIAGARSGAGADPRRLATDLNIGVGEYAGLYDWSPDSSSICLTHSTSPDPSDWNSGNLSLLDPRTMRLESLIVAEGAAIEPFFSPDGLWILYSLFDVPETTWDLRFHVIDIRTRESRPLADTADRKPCIIGWHSDSQRVLYTEYRGVSQCLCSLPIDGDSWTLLMSEGCIVSPSFDRSIARVAFASSSRDVPPEVHVRDLDGSTPARSTKVNQGLVGSCGCRTVVHRWTSSDGMGIEGLLSYPVSHDPSRRCPLIISVHGGPHYNFTDTFVGGPSFFGQVHALAARGYAVLRCNFRGSTGKGQEFRHANFQDWGGGDFRDVMTGIDSLVEAGIADGDRLGIVGWSFGGYLAAWASTQSDRFRAAVVGAGISNLLSHAGTCNAPYHVPAHFGGEIWEQTDLMASRSPVLSARHVSTPTLILHGEDDDIVSIGQGYELCTALERRGGRVEMVAYEGMGHVPDTPAQMKDIMDRTIAWFGAFLG